MADPASKAAVVAGATLGAATGAAAWIGVAQEWVSQLFGVPLPVFLAAAAGAFFARTYLQSTSFTRALAAWCGWTLIGSFGAELVRGAVASILTAQLTIGAAAGCALVLAGGGTIFFTTEIVELIRAAIRRRIDALWRPGGGNGP